MVDDPFRILGIPSGSDEKEIRAAWRDKLRASHPDAGGHHEEAVRINQALVEALGVARAPNTREGPKKNDFSSRRRTSQDLSSFTIDVLPVECWHAIEIVAGLCGSILIDEPPYLIEFTMHDSGLDQAADLWCRCEMVPEAGATTVHITFGTNTARSTLSIEEIRDFLVNSLNELDWSN